MQFERAAETPHPSLESRTVSDNGTIPLRLQRYLHGEGYTDIALKDGQVCGLKPFVYTHAIVVGLRAAGYERRYCYEDEDEARAALKGWDGLEHPPGAWIKCKGIGIDLLNPALKG